MKSVVLCEGPDDLWFIAYYLYKCAGWDRCRQPKEMWRNYEIGLLSSKLNIYKRETMELPFGQLVEKIIFNGQFQHCSINSSQTFHLIRLSQ